MAKDKPALDPKLEPGEVEAVQTGDEETPTPRPGEHGTDVKNIYKKARENRELVQRKDGEDTPDVVTIQKLVAESQDLEEHEHGPPDPIDLENRPDRHADPDAEEEEGGEVEVTATDPDPNEPVIDPEPEPEPIKSLDYEVVDVKVVSKVYGIEYLVHEQEVIDAGGLERYQRQRATNQRAERVATDAKALREEKQRLAQLPPEVTAEREPPATGALDEQAELAGLRKKLVDAAFDGSEKDVEVATQALEDFLRSTPTEPEPDTPVTVSDSTVQESIVDTEQIQSRFEQEVLADRAEANRMLMDEYPDIMQDDDLREVAMSKYRTIDASPEGYGRTPVEMAREGAEYARDLAIRGLKPEGADPDRQAEELKVRRAKKRVLPQASTAHAKTTKPETKKTPSARDHIARLRRRSGHDRPAT